MPAKATSMALADLRALARSYAEVAGSGTPEPASRGCASDIAQAVAMSLADVCQLVTSAPRDSGTGFRRLADRACRPGAWLPDRATTSAVHRTGRAWSPSDAARSS
jgi:hypothetical protein